ncbi:phosphoglycerate mutase family protein-like protein [Amylocarpus encephaloides]|uniref:Phosphoglycerate mutase family protein-like protein n=1 Tax=Amylocarpus encephaloides TaxID=45428 RepID=A0A9P7YG79_9HELO|nr:phosphoglycerate mutase family protein-like protein [Amylocarpus encephaloides]
MSIRKTIYIVRHGQGQHNGNSQVKDPILTPIGRAQCQALRALFLHHNDVQIVMASALRRTIQTAATAFAPTLAHPEVPFLLVPLAQEISDKPCDVGTNPKDLQAEMDQVMEEVDIKFKHEGRIDYSLLEEGWNSKEGIYEASLEAVTKRAAAMRKWLFQRPESVIVLVTHGAFIHHLTEDWTGLVPPKGKFANNTNLAGTVYKACEFRGFTFDETSTEDEPRLIEIGGTNRQAIRPLGAHARDIKGVEADFS